MITARNLSKNFGTQELLTSVNFLIGNGVKIGLVGKNGCGKSTLFKLLNRQEEPSSGTIEYQNEILSYIPQEFSFDHELVGEFLENILPEKWDYYKVETLISQLNYQNFDPYQSIITLSEGQKMKLKLIEALLKEPTTLFIDEPTNHLDIEGILWFEEYVKNLRINVVMISHDRSFLNHTVDEIWEIDQKNIYRFVGNYDNYKEEKLKLIDKWNQEYILFVKRKEKLENLLHLAKKINKGKMVAAAHKRLEREVKNNSKELYVNQKMEELDLNTKVHAGKLMVRFGKVNKSYGHKTIFDNLSFEVRSKEKVWLLGPNGAGKSTIVKMIMGLEQPTSGELKLGENITIGYFSQMQTHLDSKKNLLDEFSEKTGCFYGRAYGYLDKFLFDREATQKKVANLSPGERARFAFAIFAFKKYDMLILDEPDNHLDIETKEVLEKSLREYEGTLLLVSHDRYFVEEVGIERMFSLK